MKYFYFFSFLFIVGGTMQAQQLTYKPINPAFGGDTFNYQWLLSSASAQNSHSASSDSRDEQTELESFGDNLNRQILSQLSRTLLNAQVESIGDFTEEGTFTFGSLNVEVFESTEGLVINILDTSTGETTQVIVPN